MNHSKAAFLNRFPKAVCIKHRLRHHPEEFAWYYIEDGAGGVRGFGKTETEAWKDAVKDVERQEGKKLELPAKQP